MNTSAQFRNKLPFISYYFFPPNFNSIIVQLKYTILTRKAVNVNTSAQFIFFNVDPVGLEPTTYGLWGRCCWPTELRVLIKSKPLKSTLKQVLKLLVCYDVRSPCDYIVDYYYIQSTLIGSSKAVRTLRQDKNLPWVLFSLAMIVCAQLMNAAEMRLSNLSMATRLPLSLKTLALNVIQVSVQSISKKLQSMVR